MDAVSRARNGIGSLRHGHMLLNVHMPFGACSHCSSPVIANQKMQREKLNVTNTCGDSALLSFEHKTCEFALPTLFSRKIERGPAHWMDRWMDGLMEHTYRHTLPTCIDLFVQS